ncbi:MAG: ABC transporter ATP-binding protein [Firmicutes bacterium]|nr:ABC transporter ATP-binding protein [Bacillota bacterium]
MIKLEKVSKIYRLTEIETHAISEVDLEVKEGEFVAVMGPSGSGKSTLLHILGLLDMPTRGKYYLAGTDVTNLTAKSMAKIRNRTFGFIFQTFNLIPDLDAYENVEVPLIYRGLPRKQRKKMVEEAMERVGMTNRFHHYPGQLSGGQQQRVAIARALVGKPPILLADEPTGNLDSAMGAEIMELIRGLHADGSTVIMVTHDPRFAGRAQRVIKLFDGRIVGECAGEEVLRAARTAV